MISFDEFGEMLNGIAIELHEDLYKGLNGGINLIQDIKIHPESRFNDLLVLGDYNYDRDLGRYINIYYESFNRIYSHAPSYQLREKLKQVLSHEFIHHLEAMAGERDLEIEDALTLERYKREG